MNKKRNVKQDSKHKSDASKKMGDTAKSSSKNILPEKSKAMQELIETLRLNHIELQHQNHELRIKENELEASRNKYVHFFDFAPIPYLVLGVAGLIQEVNLSASSMLRVDRKKLIGKSFVSYLSAADQSAFLSLLKSVFTSPGKQSCELSIVRKDKVTCRVMLEALQMEDTLESGQKHQLALVDLIERKDVQ